jgi:hypothetical protein
MVLEHVHVFVDALRQLETLNELVQGTEPPCPTA